MNSKHTPGPWARRGTHIHYQPNPGGYRFDIAEVFRDVESETAEANARLIATAPELLEACKAIAHCTKPAMGSAEFKAWIKARDAVAKAKGEE